MRQRYNGVKFYSTTDLSCGYSLEKAETVFRTLHWKNESLDINHVIELFNIKQLFENNLRLNKWTDDDYDRYKSTTKDFDRIIAIFFANLNSSNFMPNFQDVSVEYIDDFWYLFSRFKVYERISNEDFAQAIDLPDVRIFSFLKQKDIVNYYGQTIAVFMVQSVQSAELLMSQFLEAHQASHVTHWFPKELTGKQKEEILLDYIRSGKANPNYLELIAKSQSTIELPLHDKTRLEAQKKYDDFVESHFSKNDGMSYGLEVTFSKTQKKEVLNTSTGIHELSISYSVKWIEDNLDYPTLLNNFIYLFGFVDGFFRSQFVSQPSHLSTLERVMGVKGKRDYVTGIQYSMMRMLFNAQMKCYCHELSRHEVRLELVFKWFFEFYLVDEFNGKGFTFIAPSDGTTDLEKCKLLASEIDSVLKQFTLFINEGCINRELFEMSSGQIKLENIPSFQHEKYTYPNNDVCNGCMFLLFSDQSGLAYTEKAQDNYKNLSLLLQSEAMNVDDFADYQKTEIDWLVKNRCLTIEDSGMLSLNTDKVSILKDLYYNQVSCLLYLGNNRTMLDDMKNSGEIKYETSLFSRPEQAYINYMLNKAEFSNGHDLRNKYIHGTHSLLPKDHESDYIELLKIMVLIVIKINEEFCNRQDHCV